MVTRYYIGVVSIIYHGLGVPVNQINKEQDATKQETQKNFRLGDRHHRRVYSIELQRVIDRDPINFLSLYPRLASYIYI